ncbi:hypothetical protein LTR27_009275 [Elasticomyces elasticus]|nr:hypothetical protein LTR27_009275 [Elasticomyces elasticus]
MTKRTADRAAAGSATTPAAEVVDQDRPKKKSRRMKVLSTSKLSAQQKQIYETNASDSPLLRLAPEIRNRIFSILLGEKTIHIRSHTTKGSHVVMHSICKIPGHSEEMANKITRHNALSGAAENFDRYEQLHSHCISRAPLVPNETMAAVLPVLRTCRQIHQEAALLPYQLNNFMCPSTERLSPFLQTLVPAQAHAIENLTLSDTSTHNTLSFQKLAKTKLRGLKQLSCFVDFSYYCLVRFSRTEPGKIDSITLSLLQFKSPALVTVSVLPYQNGDIRSWRDSSGASPTPITRESMRTWALGVEAALLAPEI